MNCVKLVICIILTVVPVLGHESDVDHPPIYNFKRKVFGMCAGHHHESLVELKKICNHMSEHFYEILDLQINPPQLNPPVVTEEKYLMALTGLVIYSDTLTKEQKSLFYRRSYERAIKVGKEGIEWKWLLGFLVEKTDFLTLSELDDLMRSTTHEPMKPLIKQAIERLEKRSQDAKINSDANTIDRMDQANKSPRELQEKKELNSIPRIIAATMVLMAIGLLLIKIFKSKEI